MRGITAENLSVAFLFSFLVPSIGYYYLGLLYAMLFLIGYLGGFIFWIVFPAKVSWQEIKIPFWSTLLAFVALHKVEENRMKFFEVVSEKITGDPVPELSIGLAVGLLILPIGTWLAIPVLIKRGITLGYYSLWTFFTSMGITELAHFFLPFLADDPYGYFPGMWSVFVLAPLAWWGMNRIIRFQKTKFNYHGN